MFSGARPPACEAWVGGAVGHRPDADCDVQGLGGAGHRSEPPYVESSERRGDGRLGGSGDYITRQFRRARPAEPRTYPVGEMVKPLAEETPSPQRNTKCLVRVS